LGKRGDGWFLRGCGMLNGSGGSKLIELHFAIVCLVLPGEY